MGAEGAVVGVVVVDVAVTMFGLRQFYHLQKRVLKGKTRNVSRPKMMDGPFSIFDQTNDRTVIMKSQLMLSYAYCNHFT